MSVLDWSFVSLLAIALLFLVFGIFSVVFFVLKRKKLSAVKRKRPPKNKKKRRRFIRQRNELIQQAKRQLTITIVFFVLSGLTAGGASFSRYYQQNRLQGQDSEAMVQSYYLLDELSNQLKVLQEGENPQKSINNIKELSSRLSSFGARKAYIGLSEDNQKFLNRHYVMLKEVGMNLHNQTVDTLSQEGQIQGYLEDIEKAEKNQKKVFKQFKVNESALKNKS